MVALPPCSEQDGARGQQDTNVTALLLFQYRTVLVPVVKSPGFTKIPGKSLSFIYFAPDDKNPEIHRPVFLELTPSPEMTYRTLPGTSNEMNVLGIVIFSATIGTCSPEEGAPRCSPAQQLQPRVATAVATALSIEAGCSDEVILALTAQVPGEPGTARSLRHHLHQHCP